ncbi:SDR family oxidoreductase [Flavihumibacter solisilvae]|uniref:Short-chain dehydrogenase n=1 Tax=Flavihumibacter solisilvae TaxID=1349421 RepID=A0A0C1IWJ2_9BACT|nr:SDR family oxidoreductase [Flavihumibacter solisilvae]KIC94869.1 short-chain dehydrogenase [Flavihumibacter solisilvae]
MANVLITGASRGIGMAAALTLARAGHKVQATMRNPSGSPELSKIASQESLPIIISEMDVDSDVSVDVRISTILRENQHIDVLINNAGIEERGTMEELEMDRFRAVMETNYFGPVRCIKAVLPHMRERRNGLIINIASVAGKISCSPLGPYSASKFALEAISESLAQEVKPFNIRVAIVEPGIIDTAMSRGIADHFRETAYPTSERFSNLFRAALENPSSTSYVSEKILEIIQSKDWKLRHPAGPDAEPFLQWRLSMSDEEWVDWAAADDETWYKKVEQDFGLKANPKKVTAGTS